VSNSASDEARKENRFIAFLVLAGVAGLSLSLGLSGLNYLGH
jgi:hypothetical protein